jgi:hypothetical protein
MGLPLPVVHRENLSVTGVGRLLLRIDPMPTRVRTAVQSRRDLTGRRWIILKGRNREGLLRAVGNGKGLWGFEHSWRGVR